MPEPDPTKISPHQFVWTGRSPDTCAVTSPDGVSAWCGKGSADPIHAPVRVWTPFWWDRKPDEPMVPCYSVEHHADEWFAGCPHEPTSPQVLDAARALCDETGADSAVLDVISRTYFRFWSLTSRKRRHVEQWPLALLVLAGLREAGYDVVATARDQT